MSIAALGDVPGSFTRVDLVWPSACPYHLTSGFLNELFNGWEVPSLSPALS